MTIRRVCAAFLFVLAVLPFTAPFQTYVAGDAIPSPNAAAVPRGSVVPPGDTESLGGSFATRLKPVRLVPLFHVTSGRGFMAGAVASPLPVSHARTHPLVPVAPLTLRL